MNALELERTVIASSLLAAGVLTIYCPCGEGTSGRGLLSCHIYEIGALMGLATATILYANR